MVNRDQERRQFVRGDFPFRVYIYCPKKRILTTFTEDISQGGIKVMLDRRLEINTPVDLEILSDEGEKICRGQIAWVREVKPNKRTKLYETGIRFTEKKKMKSVR